MNSHNKHRRRIVWPRARASSPNAAEPPQVLTSGPAEASVKKPMPLAPTATPPAEAPPGRPVPVGGAFARVFARARGQQAALQSAPIAPGAPGSPPAMPATTSALPAERVPSPVPTVVPSPPGKPAPMEAATPKTTLPKPAGSDEVMTTEEVVALLRQPSLDAFYQFRRRHPDFPCHKIGRALRFLRSEVMAWLKRQLSRRPT